MASWRSSLSGVTVMKRKEEEEKESDLQRA